MILFDRKRLQLHRQRASCNICEYDYLIKYAADILFEQIKELNLTNNFLVLDLGARNGYLSEKLTTLTNLKIICSDLSEKFLAQNNAINKLACDEEYLPFKSECFDLIVSNLNIHWINDLPGLLLQIKSLLKPGGTFIASLYGGVTLNKLRYLFYKIEDQHNTGHRAHISPMITAIDMASLMQRANFKDPIVESDIVNVEFTSIKRLIEDLKGMGESNCLIANKFPLNTSIIKALQEHGEFEEQFEVITVLGKK